MTTFFICGNAKAVPSRGKSRDVGIPWLSKAFKLCLSLGKHVPTIAKNENFAKFSKNLKMTPPLLCSQVKAVASRGKCHDAGLPWLDSAIKLCPLLLKHVSTVTKDVIFVKRSKKLKNDPSFSL